MRLAVHYMKPEWFRDGIMGASPTRPTSPPPMSS